MLRRLRQGHQQPGLCGGQSSGFLAKPRQRCGADASTESTMVEASNADAKTLLGHSVLLVRSIVLTGEPVFDPNRETLGDEILAGLNRLHWQTRESVIKSQLLFEVGSTLSPAALAESARLLRSRPYLMEASIKVRNPCGSEVDVEVTSHDAWSLTPRLALNRSGGNSKTGFGVREKNLLALGVQVEFKTVKNLDRQGQQFELSTKHLLNTRVQSSVHIENNDDGDNNVLAN